MRFDSYHPAINLIYFAVAIGCTVWFHHPVFLAISYVCAFVYAVYLSGKRALLLNLVLAVLIVIYTGWYAYYHHFGVTPLRRNIIGNQITLEALAAGLAIAVSAASVLMWLSCLHVICTSDKVVYLFGRISPTLSLFLAIALRMVPRIGERARRIHTAQRGIGRGTGDGNLLRRLVNGIRIFSILVTWLLESLVESAASMKCRGYGLRGRSAYAIYRFDNRDRGLVLIFTVCISVLCGAVLLDQTQIHYNPQILMNRITPLSGIFYAAYAVFLLLPMAMQIIGEARFDRLAAQTAAGDDTHGN